MGARSSQNRGPGLNKTDGHLLEYFRNTFGAGGGGTNAPPGIVSGIEASGGIVGDWTEPGPGNVYRTHIFTASGAFNVTSLGESSFNDAIDYVIVGGGGGGQAYGGTLGYELGGGGAGAFIRQGISSPKTVSVQSYPVVIGAGGAGGDYKNSPQHKGQNTTFYGLTAEGGGGAGDGSNPNAPGSAGGSGGGGSFAPPNPGPSVKVGGNASGAPAPGPVIASGDATDSPNAGWGHVGGNAQFDPNRGAGGGGAGGAGQPGPGGAHGGIGLKTGIAGPANDGVGAPGPTAGRWFAGGGGGVIDWGNTSAPPNGVGGGAGGPYAGGAPAGLNSQSHALPATGGGGGSGRGGGTIKGGNGGSGIVMVRYQIGTTSTGNAKASGGAISFHGGKTIHAFTNTGTFATNSNWTAADVEYVVVAGGASGAQADNGGGGGAGGYLTGSTPIGAHPVSYNIQIGAGGAGLKTNARGNPGSNTVASFPAGTVTATGGGGGGARTAAPGGIPGGSGGGQGWDPGNPQPAGTGVSGQGYPGGTSSGTTPFYAAGGGGGAGGAGQNGSGGSQGHGGIGKQLPATFHDPNSGVGQPGPTATNVAGGTPGKFWVAGGGGGGSDTSPGWGSGGGAGGPYAGGGDGIHVGQATGGAQNTGGGGGGTGNAPSDGSTQPGGSGVVLIAYPT